MSDTATLTNTKVVVKEPSMYKVVLLNDDYTPMNFVVFILMAIFNKSEDEAQAVMLEVHNKGQGVAGVFTYEVAEQKVFEVSNLASDGGHPLRLKIVKE